MADLNMQFLAGSGEMATLTRAKDWHRTPVGSPDKWPQSLRTTISIVLNSKFPMFLWWGHELVCFYNDAYRPSLGANGKHPRILGMPASEAWPEIWDIIKPLIDQVLTMGEATWSEDQLIPIFRNGRIENVYWTVSYSPVYDESGEISGVLVTCSETTSKVVSLRLLEESNRRYHDNIMQAPVAMAVFRGESFIVEIANNLMLELWGKTAEGILNRPIFDGLPEVMGQGFEELLENVYHSGEKFVATERPVSLPREGKMEMVFVNFVCQPLKNPEGKITGIVSIATDVTEQVLERQRIELSEKRFRNTIKQAPMGITILQGADFVVEAANDTYLKLVDKKENEFVGRPLFETLPEVRDVVAPLLMKVMNTGKSFNALELEVRLNRYGKEETTYFDLIYHPLTEEDGKLTGIIVVATEVTNAVNAKHSLAESERQFRNVVMQSPIPMAIFRGPEYIIEMANGAMMEKIWRRTEHETIGKKALEVFPELNDQKYPELLHRVFTTGVAHGESEAVAYVNSDTGLRKFYLDFEYKPLSGPDGSVSGIMITVNDVSEKVEARKKVEEAEERLRLATEAMELSTWDLDLQTGEIIYSPRLSEIFGHPATKKLSHTEMRGQVHPDDIHDVVEKAFQVALKTGVYKYEARLITPLGDVRWISTHGKVFFDEKRSPLKMIGTLRDITEEKKYQRDLEESEQKFRLLADSMPQHIWTADPRGNLNYFNKSVYRFSGLTPEKLDEVGWLNIVHPDDREKNVAAWMESIVSGEDFLLEHRFRRHDGVYRWQLSRAIAQRDPGGTIQMWVGTSTDIEDQKSFAAELERKVSERTRQLNLLNEELIKSEERYHLMVEEVQDYAILYLSRDGRVKNWNRGAQKIKGYQASEIIGKSFSEFYSEEDKQTGLPDKLLNHAALHGKAKQEGWRVRKGGTRFWASVVITAVHDSQRNVIGFSKVTHDLTEKKEAEDQLMANAQQMEEKNRELEKMNAELQSFAYVSSHDLQEPLRKIQTFASRIMDTEESNLSDTGKDYFMRMKDAASRMQTLIQDLLAYSRTNTVDRIFKLTDLNVILAEVKNDFKETMLEKGAVIETTGLCEISVIPFQFRQLLNNLIGNALKFSKAGRQPVINITGEQLIGGDTRFSPGTRLCHIRVSDNGIGFDPVYRERIFEVFQRLHGKDRYSGTGIGLAIVKKIVENHSGIITASSVLNEGATFDIYLPMG